MKNKLKRNLSNGMKYKRNLSNGIKKIFLLIVLFAFSVFNPLSIFAVEEGSDHPSEIGTTDILERYTRSADKIVEVFDVQTTTVLPNLDKIGDVYKDILLDKIVIYNDFVNDFTDSIYENQDASGLFTQILGDYRFLRKAIYRIRKFNTLAQELESVFTLINSTESFVRNPENEVSDPDSILTSLAESKVELNYLATSMEYSISYIFTKVIDEMELKEYSTAIDLLEAERQNYYDFVIDYNIISDEVIYDAEDAISGGITPDDQSAEECKEGGGEWTGKECICEKGEWNDIEKLCE